MTSCGSSLCSSCCSSATEIIVSYDLCKCVFFGSHETITIWKIRIGRATHGCMFRFWPPPPVARPLLKNAQQVWHDKYRMSRMSVTGSARLGTTGVDKISASVAVYPSGPSHRLEGGPTTVGRSVKTSHILANDIKWLKLVFKACMRSLREKLQSNIHVLNFEILPTYRTIRERDFFFSKTHGLAATQF